MGVKIEDILSEFYNLTEEEKEIYISDVLTKFRINSYQAPDFNENLDFYQVNYLLPVNEAITMDDEITNTLDEIIVNEDLDMKLITDIKKYKNIPISVLTIQLLYNPNFSEETQKMISLIENISEGYNILMVRHRDKWSKPGSSKNIGKVKYTIN